MKFWARLRTAPRRLWVALFYRWLCVYCDRWSGEHVVYCRRCRDKHAAEVR